MDDWPIPTTAELPEHLQALIKPELEPGERLLWASESSARPSMDGSDPAFLGLWAASFGTVAIFSFAALNRAFGTRLQPADDFLAWTSVIAAIISFFLGVITTWSLSTPIRSRLSPIRRNVYALTDRRAIIWSPGPNRKGTLVHSYVPSKVRDISRTEYPDGSGSVIVSLTHPQFQPFGILDVPDVRRVDKLARSVLLADGPKAAEDDRASPDY